MPKKISIFMVLLAGIGLASCGSENEATTAPTGKGCLPNSTQKCLCSGAREGVQACRSDGEGYSACDCSTGGGKGGGAGASGASPGGASQGGASQGGTSQGGAGAENGGQGPSGGDDDSPFPGDQSGLGAGDDCGKKLGVYRGIPIYSNGDAFGLHQCSDLDACQGDNPEKLSCAKQTKDGCGDTLTLRTGSGIAYQCVEFVRRFFVQRYAKNLACYGQAVGFWRYGEQNPDSYFDLRMANGASKQLPQPDDVIVFSKGPADKIGHVAIVRKVASGSVFIIQQNVLRTAGDASYRLDMKISADGVVTLFDGGGALDGFVIEGWLRSSKNDPMSCKGEGDCPGEGGEYGCVDGHCKAGGGVTCGDGKKDASEDCDKGELGGKDCVSLGFDSGVLACGANCAFDTGTCCKNECAKGATRCLDAQTTQTCGDFDGNGCNEWGLKQNCEFGCEGVSCKGQACDGKKREGTEQCDGADLGGSTCKSLGYEEGALSCSASCTYQTSACCNSECPSPGATQCLGDTRQTCGNYDGDSCREWGGDINCPYGCVNGQCQDVICGDGKVQGNEECEVGNFNGQTCQSKGFDGGTLTCSQCNISAASCCSNQCSPGSSTCVGNDRYQCSSGGDGCYASSFAQNCPNGCSGGQCTDCSANFCQTNGYGSGNYCSGSSLVTCGTSGGCKTASTTPCPNGCSNNACQSCSNGQTESKSCNPSAFYCPLGTQTRTCSGGSWGGYGACQASTRYFGDGAPRCDTPDVNGNANCLTVSASGSNSTLSATLSKNKGGVTFGSDVTLRVFNPSTGQSQSLGCVSTSGKTTYTFAISPASLGASFGQTISVKAEIKGSCGSVGTFYSGESFVSQCAP